MSSLRIKIVLSLIGMSMLSIALGGFYSRLVLSHRFEDVVMVRGTEEFARDVIGYFRNNNDSFELAYSQQSWEDHMAVLNETRQIVSPVPESNAHFIATDLDGKVWIPGGSFTVGDIASEQELQDAIPILSGNTIIGYVLVQGQLQLSGSEAQYLTDLINSLWLSFIIVVFVAVPLGIILGKRLTNPINNLTDAIQAMNPKTMSQSVPITSNDEIGLLSQSFNQMSEDLAAFVEVTEQQKKKITEAESMRRQALVSISHELRTPLYGLVSQAYAILDGIRPLDHSEVTKLAVSLDHLSELVDDLYHLSLSDVHRLKCEIEPIDFAVIVQKVLEAKRQELLAKNFTLSLTMPDSLPIDADSTRLRQIVENLLVNCIRYADQSGEIKVELSTVDQFAELVVSDSGPGVPPESLGSLFDRFYRVEHSRSRATGGTGIGLSLVKTCAELHQGNVEAFQSIHGGLGIRVRIPLNPSIEQTKE